MPPNMSLPKWLDRGWLLVCLLASSAWCITAADRLSATWDEPAYVAHGLEHWRSGSIRSLACHGTMPLPMDVATLPLYVWERWQGTPLDPVTDLDHLLPWARASSLIFWWLLLIYGWLTGRELAGPWGGRVAVTLLACEPTLLAHATLATTDMALSACLLALTYHFHRGRGAGWFRRIGWPAFWLAASMLAKLSGLAFGPLCLGIIEMERIFTAWRKRRRATSGAIAETVPCARLSPFRLVPAAFRPFWRDMVQIMPAALILVLLYCINDAHPIREFVNWTHRLPDNPMTRTLVWTAEHLRVANVVGEAFKFQVHHNRDSHVSGCYGLGLNCLPHWYYFPLVSSMKLTLPLLVLPILLVLIRPRSLLNWAYLSGLALLLFSLQSRIQIGVRLVLPAVVLGTVGLAVAFVRAPRPNAVWMRRFGTACLSACLAWSAFSCVHVWPHGLCYVNELWGGTENGYLYVGDSNYDWGQGLKDLDRWRREHGVTSLALGYFGDSSVLHDWDVSRLPLPDMWLDGPDGLLARARGHYLAVSTTLVYSHGDSPAVLYLRRLPPVDRTMTFLIYDFTGKTPLPQPADTDSICAARLAAPTK
ncbi:MAG TPA: glycosyltransferase family 39 protein [Gemmataceae bacterium]|nr:glycosyltransferase family 39 protein [Gemmataceae bacterium]